MEIINKSKSYLLPLFSEYIDIKFVNLINNTFLYLENDDTLYMIIQFKTSNETYEYINELSINQYYIKSIDQNIYTSVVFRIPEGLVENFNKFINGNFSLLDKKDTIIDFLTKNYNSRQFRAIQRIKQVLYKDKALKAELEYSLDVNIPEDSELSSIPDKNAETLKL